MKKDELERYSKTDYITEGRASVLNKIRPLFSRLIAGLVSLPDDVSLGSRLDIFRSFIENVNEYEDEIETVEREEILRVVYEIGSIVSINPEVKFAEQWRGDW